mmetsp:Transcript_42704/g.56384  ORF Transcript_42704/g.56384 Transcript_42704/m.56384 type:complete len:98 (+) Transcript_42704:155-448(+)
MSDATLKKTLTRCPYSKHFGYKLDELEMVITTKRLALNEVLTMIKVCMRGRSLEVINEKDAWQESDEPPADESRNEERWAPEEEKKDEKVASPSRQV